MDLRNSKSFWVVLLLVCLSSIGWCIYRDVQVRKQYPIDLRNRVVGSRLQMDGKSPYFYHWKLEDGLRYYDWSNGTSNLKISNVTATPFFHQIISPVVNYSQYEITKIWLAANYLAFFAMLLFGLLLCSSNNQRIAVILTAVAFLYTHAWLNNTYKGQMYFFIALLSLIFYYLLSRVPNTVNAIVAGGIAMTLLLIRPTTIIYLLPFLLLASRFPLRFKAAMAVSASVILLLAMCRSSSRLYWRDYQVAVNQHIKMHQGLHPDTQATVYVPMFTKWEGWDIDSINEAKKFPYYTYREANSNAFVIINKVFRVHTPLWVITASFIILLVILSIFYWKLIRVQGGYTLYSIAIFGFLLYMLGDIFSPVHRFHYNASQWLFPLLLTASSWHAKNNILFVVMLCMGILLNSLAWRLFPMQQSVGEYLMLISLFGLLFTNKLNNAR